MSSTTGYATRQRGHPSASPEAVACTGVLQRGQARIASNSDEITIPADCTQATGIVKKMMHLHRCRGNIIQLPQITSEEERMVNVSDGAKVKLLEYLKENKSDLAVRVILSHG
jgi:hypothetical protein